jgi:hypothetical protein
MASAQHGSGKSTPIANFQPIVTPAGQEKNTHPGIPDKKGKCRSPQEMKEIREKEALEKEKTKEKQKKKIKNVAQIEDNLRREKNERSTSNRSTVAPFRPSGYDAAKSAELGERQGECFNI